LDTTARETERVAIETKETREAKALETLVEAINNLDKNEDFLFGYFKENLFYKLKEQCDYYSSEGIDVDLMAKYTELLSTKAMKARIKHSNFDIADELTR